MFPVANRRKQCYILDITQENLMNQTDAETLVGWLRLVHPGIIEEFANAKARDPEFRTLPPSQQYLDTKKEIDALVEASKYEFTQKNIPPYKERVGYYYKDQLAFVYDCTCVAGGKLPHLTYWTDFFKHDNKYKESIRNDGNFHFISIDGKHIVKRVQRILSQISAKGSHLDTED